MLTALMNRLATRPALLENHDILTNSEKDAIASHLPQAMLQPETLQGSEIDTAVTFFHDKAALVRLHSGRKIHVTGHSFWENSQTTTAVNQVSAIIKKAQEREAVRLAIRQHETDRALRRAIQERRQQRQQITA